MFITLQLGRSTREWTKWRRNGVATNHWVFLRRDWSPVSSWFYYQSQPYSKDEEKWYNHDIPNTNREIVIGLNHMLAYVPFLLVPGDFALAPSVLTPCVYMQRQRQETNRQAMEGKNAESKWEGIKWISMISMVSKEAKKQANRQKVTGKKANKRWCPQRTNVGDRPNTNWPLVIKLIY